MIISNTLHTAAIAGLESAVNQALLLDPSTLKKLKSLEDHVFLLQCTAPEMECYLIPGDGEIRLCGVFGDQADTTLSGSAQAFISLATASDPASELINGDVTLHGNSQALIQLQKILKQLELDWEAPLAKIFGDIAAHQMGSGILSGLRFGAQAWRGIKRQFDEYLVEESDLLAPTWQADKFFGEVDMLAQRAERFEAKLHKLRQKLQNPPTNN